VTGGMSSGIRSLTVDWHASQWREGGDGPRIADQGITIFGLFLRGTQQFRGPKSAGFGGRAMRVRIPSDAPVLAAAVLSAAADLTHDERR